jgi:hypothetical protein
MKLSILLPILLALMMAAQILPAQDNFAIEHLRNKPIVKGKLNGRTAYFLLDTGSDLSVLHDGAAGRYDFGIKRMVNPQRVTGIGKGGSMDRAGRAELLLGSLPVSTAWFTCDLQGIIRSIYHKTQVRIVGIIGSDVMLKYGFIIDYAQEKVYHDPIRQSSAFNKE